MAERSLRFDLIARDKSFSRALGQAEKKASLFQRSIGGVGRSVAGAFAGGAVLAGIKRVTDAGSDLNETVNKTGLAFGKNAGEIQAWARGSAKSMGLPRQAALEGASSFGLLFSKLGVAGGEAANMSTAMVQLAVDLGSVHNADPTQIIEAQTAAFRGEYDSIQRFVPALSDAAVKTEALRQTGKKSAAQLTDQEKAQAVYSVMLRQTTKEQGDFARTANESANKGKILAARVQDMQANLGTLLLPAVTAAANALGDMGDWTERNQGAAKALGVGIVALTGFVVAMNVATKVAAATQAAIRGATLAWAAAQRVLNFALAANPIGLVITLVALLVAGIVLAYKKSETFRRIVDGVWAGVKRSVGTAVNFIIDAVRGWLNVQIGVVQGILRVMGKLPGPMGAPFRKAEEDVTKAKNTINTELDRIQRRINRLTGKDIQIDAKARVRVSHGTVNLAQAVGGVLPRGGFSVYAGGGRVPGWGGGDIHPAMLEPGEAVVRKDLAARPDFRSWAKAQGIPGYQRGGIVGDIDLFARTAESITGAMGRRLADRLAAEIGSGLSKAIERAAGALGGLSGPGGWRWQMAVLRRQFPGLQLISGFRPGAITATGNRSYHALGRAVDVPPRMDVANWIRGAYGLRTRELIFSPMGARQIHNGRDHVYSGITRAMHWNHVHWAYDKGGWLPPGVTVAHNRTGRPERVLPPGPVIDEDRLAKKIAGELATALGRVSLVATMDPNQAVYGIRTAQRRRGIPAAQQIR